MLHTSNLYVHFGPADDPDVAERHMLDIFAMNVPNHLRELLVDPDLAIPFANLQVTRNQRKRHGIRGAKATRNSKDG